MIMTNTREGCSYPMNSQLGAYQKGCRCTSCVENKKANNARYNREVRDMSVYDARRDSTAERRAQNTLRQNKARAKEYGYAPIDATWQEVMELQTSTTTCQCCGADGPLHTDHCHETGKLRGMLCPSCNTKDVLNG